MVIMNINIKIHTKNHLIKNILGNVEYLLSKLSLKKNELHIINYHGTQKKFLTNFRNQLAFFQEHFLIISPQDLDAFYQGKLNSTNKPLLLITFDDGIKNNTYAATILKEFKLKAFFFIIPDFVDTPIHEQKEYFLKNIRPSINPNIDYTIEDFNAMNWHDIKNLLKDGHLVGSHTKSHTLISKRSSITNSVIEIADSKMIIAKKLNISPTLINVFCSINNSLESIGIKEKEIIQKNYSYHFSTLPGRNRSNSDPLFVRRINIETYWLMGAVKYATGKWGIKKWKNRIKEYENLG